jgi:hypothetical protein
LLAALDPSQNGHERSFAEALSSSLGPRVLSPFVVAEPGYMILLRNHGRGIWPSWTG